MSLGLKEKTVGIKDLKEELFCRYQRQEQGTDCLRSSQVGTAPAWGHEAGSGPTRCALYLPHAVRVSPLLLRNDSSSLSALGLLCSARLPHQLGTGMLLSWWPYTTVRVLRVTSGPSCGPLAPLPSACVHVGCPGCLASRVGRVTVVALHLPWAPPLWKKHGQGTPGCQDSPVRRYQVCAHNL